MVLLASTFDQSRFLRAEDLPQPKKLRIKNATEEIVGRGADAKKMLVVWLTNDQRGLALNRTNNRTIRGAFGDPVDGWTGKVIEVFPTQAEFRGHLVPALRVRIPSAKHGGQIQPSTAEQLDEFAQPTKSALVQQPELKDDLDDEISF